MFERLVSLLNNEDAFRLIEKGFNGQAKLDEFFRLPTLSIFTKMPNVDENESTEQSLEDIPLAKDDN